MALNNKKIETCFKEYFSNDNSPILGHDLVELIEDKLNAGDNFKVEDWYEDFFIKK